VPGTEPFGTRPRPTVPAPLTPPDTAIKSRCFPGPTSFSIQSRRVCCGSNWRVRSVLMERSVMAPCFRTGAGQERALRVGTW